MHNGLSLFLNLNNNLIGGMTAQVSLIDEGQSTKTGVDAVTAALKSRSHDVLIGVANSQVMAAIPDDVTAARIPLLGTNGSPANMRSSDFIWRTSYVAGEASTALAAYIVDAPKGVKQVGELFRPNSVAVYHDGSADGQAEAAAFTDIVGGSSLPMHTVSGTPSSVMNQVRSFGSELLYAAASGSAATELVSAYTASGLSTALCGPGALTELDASKARKVFTSMNYAPDLNNDANETFTSGYFAQFSGKVPTTYAMTTYDAAIVLDNIISGMTGEVTPFGINAALGDAQSFDSPRGRWQFNQGRTPLQQWYLRQVRLDGRYPENMVLADLETLT